MTSLSRLKNLLLQPVIHIGSCGILLSKLLTACLSVLLRPSLLTAQIYSTGILSLPIILVSGLFVGMVLGLQGYTNLIRYGAESSLGALVALSLVRELGPVLAALLYAGRAGSALTAEIGTMKSTEQLDAMAMMAVDPVKRILAPRFTAGIIALPLLAMIFTITGIIGGYFIAVQQLGVDSGAFWSQMQSAVEFRSDLVNGVVIKSVAFAVVINLIAVHEGFNATPTSEGVGRATTKTVVRSSLAVLALDFILTALFFGDI